MDLETIKKIAEMARLSVPEEELGRVAESMAKMVSFVDTIKNVDVKSVDSKYGDVNVFREDIVSPISSAQDLIEVAPQHLDHFVKVPKIIE